MSHSKQSGRKSASQIAYTYTAIGLACILLALIQTSLRAKLAYMVSTGAIKLGRVAWRRGGEHGRPPLQWVGMEVTVISRLTLKLHSIVCTPTISNNLSTCTEPK